ncbi:MAG: hypothetical protein U0U67_04670 [Chitinophagales bacterium]
MDKKSNIDTLVKELGDLFCTLNKQDKRYESIWLSEVDSELYNIDKYILCVKALHHIDSCNEEIIYLTKELFEKLSIESRSLIWRIAVINSNEELHCTSEDLEVFSTEETHCS